MRECVGGHETRLASSASECARKSEDLHLQQGARAPLRIQQSVVVVVPIWKPRTSVTEYSAPALSLLLSLPSSPWPLGPMLPFAEFLPDNEGWKVSVTARLKHDSQW